MILNNRKCLVTRKSKSKDDLIRIAKTKDGKFYVNSNIKARGAYVSKDADMKSIIKNRLLHKAFKMNVPNEVYDELKECLKGGNNVKK